MASKTIVGSNPTLSALPCSAAANRAALLFGGQLLAIEKRLAQSPAAIRLIVPFVDH